MKKILSCILALVMVLALAACGGSGTPAATEGPAAPDAPASQAPATQAPATQAPAEGGDEPAPAPAAAGKAYPNCNADGSINLDTIGHFDPEYDYSQNPRYKVCYVSTGSSPLSQEAARAYESWCAQMNMEWMGFSSSEGDNDLFMTLVQNQIDQNVEILILDPDNNIIPAVADLMAEHPECAWMSMMSPPRDTINGEGIPVGGNLVHPSVGFSHYDAGWQQMIKLFDWMKETYPDADWSEVGCLSMDYTLMPELHNRSVAAVDYWKQYAPAEAQDNIFIGDMAAAGFTLQSGIDVGGPIVSTHGNIKYWLVQGNVDDWAMGVTQVVEQAGLSDTSCVVSFGGAGLQMQWDAGQQNCFRYALYSANILYAEPIIGGCYAFKMGWATPETIWPKWVNQNDCGGAGHTYASLLLPTTWLAYDNYKSYLEWCDLYAGTQLFNYDGDVTVAIDDYSAFVEEVPASYKN